MKSTSSNNGLTLSGNWKMIERNRKNIPNEYSHIEASPICLRRLAAIVVLSMKYIESLLKNVHSLANAFLVEGLLAVGASIGIYLVAVLFRAGW